MKMNEFESLISKLEPGMVAVLGVPFDDNSSFMRGSALAPQRISEALHSGSSNFCVESGLDLRVDSRWCELGNLELSTSTPAFSQIEKAIATLLTHEARVLTLGGDHSILGQTASAHLAQTISLGLSCSLQFMFLPLEHPC